MRPTQKSRTFKGHPLRINSPTRLALPVNSTTLHLISKCLIFSVQQYFLISNSYMPAPKGFLLILNQHNNRNQTQKGFPVKQ